MDNTTMTAILWVAAVAVFGLYLLRRKKRNVLGSK